MIGGSTCGTIIIWGAKIFAVPIGRLTILPAFFDGLLAAIGGGTLLALIITKCSIKEQQAEQVHPGEQRFDAAG